MNRGRYRFIQEDACLHRSTLLRIRALPYAPRNLSSEFLEKVRNLQDVPNNHPTIGVWFKIMPDVPADQQPIRHGRRGGVTMEACSIALSF